MISYTLSLSNPERHLFLVEIDLETNGSAAVDIEFPAWSPGRYFIYDFARNVQDLSARAGRSALAVEKTAKGTWRIATGGHERVRISYRMYGDTLSGTFSQLDDRHASVNGSSVFGYIVGRATEPIELEVRAPVGWKAYCSMKRKRSSGRTVFSAPNYDVLIDSPFEIGTPIARRFVCDDITYHVIIDLSASSSWKKSAVVRERLDRFVGETEKTVRTQTSTFGRPEFDEYYFLVNIDPFAPHGDGMEHLASTRLVFTGSLTKEDRYGDLLDVMSHEFFHIWNVKRLRPAELGPFDYSRELYTTLLWFAEGFTQYYGHLMLRRAGVIDDKRFYVELAGEFNAVDQSPGRFHRNLRESSYDTWQQVSARNPLVPAHNLRNTYVNYYPKGAVVAFMLDLEIRRLTSDRKSLDDVMRELYRVHYAEQDIGEYYLRGTGFTQSDVFTAVESIAGRAARNTIVRLVEERDEIDYARYLRHVGLEVTRIPKSEATRKSRTKNEDKPRLYLGLALGDTKAGSASEFVPIVNVFTDSPAERAGLSPGDAIIAVDGERATANRWESIMEMKRPGERLEVTVFRGARLMTIALTPVEEDRRAIRIDVARSATAKQLRSRERWLEGHAGRANSRGTAKSA